MTKEIRFRSSFNRHERLESNSKSVRVKIYAQNSGVKSGNQIKLATVINFCIMKNYDFLTKI